MALRETWRFVLVMSLGVLDASWCLCAQHIDRAWDLGDDLLLAITIGFRFCLFSAAAIVALKGRQGLRNGR